MVEAALRNGSAAAQTAAKETVRMDESGLIRAAQAGDRAAFDELLDFPLSDARLGIQAAADEAPGVAEDGVDAASGFEMRLALGFA